MAKRAPTPDVRAVLLAARWAQRIGLPPGNLWEPAITRHLLAEWQALGASTSAWGLTEALFCARLGLEVE